MKKITVVLILFIGLLTFIVSTNVISDQQEPQFNETIYKRTINADYFRQGDLKRITYYSAPVNMPDDNGDLVPIEDYVNLSFVNRQIFINWSDKAVILDPFVTHNNVRYTFWNIGSISSQINATIPIQKLRGRHKFALDIKNIPAHIRRNINNVGFTINDTINFNLTNITTFENTMVFDDIIKFDLNDIITDRFSNSNFVLTIVNNSEIVITNVTDIERIFIDPSVTYNFSSGFDNIVAFGCIDGDGTYPPSFNTVGCTAGLTDFTGDANLDSSDDQRIILDNANDYQWLKVTAVIYDFTNVTNITYMNWTIESQTEFADTNLTLYIANNNTQKWEYRQDISSTTDIIATINITKPVIDYIEPENWTEILLQVSPPSTTDGFAVDFIKLDVLASDPDIAPPLVYITSPANLKYVDPTINITLNVSAYDVGSGISKYWYSLNGGNNVTFSANLSIAYLYGANNITVWANDTLNNVNSTTVFFNMTFSPVITEINVSNSSTSYTRFDVNRTGLVGWWRFDENRTDIVIDQAGIRNVTITGTPRWENNAIVGGSYNFSPNANNKRMSIGTTAQYPYGNITDKPFTFAGWLRRFDTTSNSETVLYANARANSGCAIYGTQCSGYQYSISSSNVVFNIMAQNLSGSLISNSISYTIASGQGFIPDLDWHFYTVTHNGTRGTNVSMYIDGKEYPFVMTGNGIGDWNAGGSWGLVTGESLAMGDNPQHSGAGLNGTLDEAMIFNRSLSDDEVYKLYAYAKPKFTTERNFTLNVTVTDLDSNLSLMYYRWFINNELEDFGFNKPTYTFIDYSARTYNVTVYVNDSDDNYNRMSWNITLYDSKPIISTINISNTTTSYTNFGFNNSGLVAYFKMDFDNSTQQDSSTYKNHATAYANASFVEENVINGAYYFDKQNGYLLSTYQSQYNLSSQFTLLAWMKPSGGQKNMYVISKAVSCPTGGRMWDLYYSYQNYYPYLSASFDGSATTDFYWYSGMFPSNQWNHFAMTYDMGNVSYYKNAELNYTNTVKSGNRTWSNSNNLLIAGGGCSEFDSNVRDYNGTLDEVMLFNRTLSEQEITAIYSMKNPEFQEIANTTINLTLIDVGTPETNLYYRWFIDGIESFVGLAKNVYNLNFTNRSSVITVIINDTDNFNVTQTFNISTLYINPLTDYDSPTESTGTNRSRSWIFANISVTEPNFKNITFVLYNQSGTINTTRYTTQSFAINWTSLLNGLYYYNVSVYDLVGNLNTTEQRTLRLDTLLPFINITSPSNSTTFSTTSIQINYSTVDSDSGINNCWWTNNSGTTNNSLSNCNNLTSTFPEGFNSIRIYSNDTAGNEDYDLVAFTITLPVAEESSGSGDEADEEEKIILPEESLIQQTALTPSEDSKISFNTEILIYMSICIVLIILMVFVVLKNTEKTKKEKKVVANKPENTK